MKCITKEIIYIIMFISLWENNEMKTISSHTDASVTQSMKCSLLYQSCVIKLGRVSFCAVVTEGYV